MSVSDEEPYSTIFASLKHPIRRRILRMLSKKPMSFSEMLGALAVSSSFLTYHLENLGELVGKIDDGKYKLSSFGEAAMATMTKVEDIPTTALQQSTETKPKKVIGRSVAIALGIMCILLIAGLVGAFAYYINDKNNTISLQNLELLQLHDTNANLGIEITQLQAWLIGNETLLNQTQANNTNLQNQVNNFYIGSTENSTIWVNNEILNMSVTTGENVSDGWIENVGWTMFPMYVPSAGYVSIRVSSNNNSTYLRLGNAYILNDTYFFPTYYQFSVGFGGTVVFPVLRASWIEIYYGISIGEATLTMTITYYY